MMISELRRALGILALAADAEAKRQTPPAGGLSAFYRCPACGTQRTIRRDLRAHLLLCERYRALIFGFTSRSSQVS